MNAIFSKYDEDIMREAISLAQKSAQEGEIPVGAIITYNERNNENENEKRSEKIIAMGRNQNRQKHNPTLHAEIIAIQEACNVLKNERLGNCTLYVTKEPCAMCAGAIIHSRIERVVIAANDEKYGACGSVFNILGNSKFNHCPIIQFGLLEQDAREIIQSFFKALRKK